MLRLTHERVQRAWTKARLARRARLDQALVSKFESGQAKPYPRELRRLATALGLPATEADRLLDEMTADPMPAGGPVNPKQPTVRHASSADARPAVAKTNSKGVTI
jgi:transcriptional regulator with XRE-family HTH domain